MWFIKGVGRWGEVCRNREECLQEWNGRNDVCKSGHMGSHAYGRGHMLTVGVTCLQYGHMLTVAVTCLR